MKDKKVVFMGTPDFSIPILEKLNKETNVILVVTMKDKPRGRKNILTPSPIKRFALDNNLKVFTPDSIKKDFKLIVDLKPDIIITCAYGGILPKDLLNIPKYGCINVHASLLPKYRGASPIHSAVINGEKETGITIMYMDEKMDTGDIISSSKININDSDNTGLIHDKLSLLGSELLIETLPQIFDGKVKRIKQNDSDATYCKKLTKEDEHISFDDSSVNIYNKIRGLNPYPGCYIKINNKVIKVIESKIGDKSTKKYGTITSVNKDSIGISTNDNDILITKIKPEGKKEMLIKDYLNGNKDIKEGVVIK